MTPFLDVEHFECDAVHVQKPGMGLFTRKAFSGGSVHRKQRSRTWRSSGQKLSEDSIRRKNK